MRLSSERLGVEMCFQDGSLTLLLAGSFSSLPCGSLLRATWASLQHVSWPLLEQVVQETGQGGSHIAFYDLASEVIPYHAHHILFSKSESLSEATLKEREIKLCLLKGLVSKNLWTYLKTTTVLIVVNSLCFFS